MKKSLQELLFLLVCITNNSAKALEWKAPLPLCVNSESCQPIVCNDKTGIFSGSTFSGKDKVLCARGGQNGCEDPDAPGILGGCTVCEDLTKWSYKSCTTADGKPGCRRQHATLTCAPDQKFSTECKKGIKGLTRDQYSCTTNRGTAGCQYLDEKYCTAIPIPSPTGTPTCQCPDGVRNGDQPARTGHCDRYSNNSGYYYRCGTK